MNNNFNTFKKFKIEDIELMLMLLNYKNLSKVSHMFNLSQPAISARLEKFRDYYQDKLIVKHSNQMILTEKGESIFTELDFLFKNIQNFFSNESFNPNSNKYSINLYINEYYIYKSNFIGSLVEAFKQYNKDHKINIHAIPLKQNFILKYGFDKTNSNVDLIIGSTNKINNFNDYIIDSQKLVIAYDRYPIKNNLTREDYYKLPQISVDFIGSENILRNYIGTDDPRNIKYRLSSVELLKQLLQDQYIVTLTREVAESIGLKYQNLPFDTDEIPIYMLVPNEKNYDHKNKWIREQVIQVINEYI